MRKMQYLKTFEGFKYKKLKKEDLKIGDVVIYSYDGIFDWEDIDEAEHGGLVLGQEVTITDFDPTDYSIKVEDSDADTWISGYHFSKK